MKPGILFILILFLPQTAISETPAEKLVNEAEAAFIRTDYETTDKLIKDILKLDPDSIDALRIIVRLDIATMNIDKMLFDYKEYKKRLGKEDPEVLLFAIMSLLTKSASHENYYVRSAAVKAVGDMGQPGLASFVLPALKDEVSYVRFFAVETLGMLGGKDLLPVFDKMLADEEDTAVKIELVKAIKQLGGPNAIGILSRLKESENPGVRLLTLGYLGGAGDKTALSLLALKHADTDPLTRAVTVNAMGYIKGSEPLRFFKESAQDSDNGVRTYTAYALSKVQNHERLTILKGMTGDSDPQVRAAVIESIGKYPDAPVDILHNALKDKDSYVRMEAYAALRHKSIAVDDSIMRDFLEDEDYEIRHSALGRIGSFEDENDIALIRPTLKDPVDRVRIAAVRALGRIRGEEALQLLKTSLADSSPAVQAYAAGNLGGLLLNTPPVHIDGRE